MARDPYHSRCVTCGEEFTTQAAQTRHMNASGHRRFLWLDQDAGTNERSGP